MSRDPGADADADAASFNALSGPKINIRVINKTKKIKHIPAARDVSCLEPLLAVASAIAA